MQLHDLTLSDLSTGLSGKKFSSRDIVDALLARVAKADGKLHAFTEVYAKEAKALADAADTARASGFPLGPLHGLPMIYKDLCDTGGSVRIPCAFNGLVGLKVTFGRISLHGTMLLSWTLDSIGPMARSVEDCALLLNALAAPDPRDPTTLGQPLEDFTAATKAGSIEGMRIAVPDSKQLPEFMNRDVVQACQTAARTFESLGATVEAVRLPGWFFEMAQAAGIISTSEMFSLHRAWIEDEKKPI